MKRQTYEDMVRRMVSVVPGVLRHARYRLLSFVYFIFYHLSLDMAGVKVAMPSSTLGISTPVVRVAVVGAGVVGLSVARVLKERHGAAVLVDGIAAAMLDGTTSSGAAGLWEPYKLTGTSEALVHKWGVQSYDHFMALHEGAAREVRV